MDPRLAFALAFATAAAGASVPGSIQLNNGVSMPLLSLGTGEYNSTTLEQAIATAVRLGFRGVDTAFNYYNQVSVGRAVRKAGRQQLFVTTKTTPCIHPQARPPYNITDVSACEAQTRSDIESDFAQLALDKVDLLMLHGANHHGPGVCGKLECALNLAQWRIYEEYLAAGKVRAIGISNFCPSCIECLLHGARIIPAVNQIKFHVGMTADPEGLISYSVGKGIVPMAYSPLGVGELFADPLLVEIGAQHNKTAAQVALHWIVAKGFPLAVASSSPSHLAQDLDLFGWGLSAQEMTRIDAYSKGSDTPSWACTSSDAGSEDVLI
eukprot:CAMPEP_0180552886 /NCGR_PEP_ID=MMETSP1036_2-20121128/73962_1 /TAXON_ID=632150 /ORGANISM="Azadinium spinosum, Strain 3D9" /LENGTH=323 /DNA_ID=CAMNT_0022568325 /DNA_START=63 /DNA_END=1034 /DNA_ORIENTATION=+